jgi:hypothetical protein
MRYDKDEYAKALKTIEMMRRNIMDRFSRISGYNIVISDSLTGTRPPLDPLCIQNIYVDLSQETVVISNWGTGLERIHAIMEKRGITHEYRLDDSKEVETMKPHEIRLALSDATRLAAVFAEGRRQLSSPPSKKEREEERRGNKEHQNSRQR